jgi:hypothetical protein
MRIEDAIRDEEIGAAAGAGIENPGERKSVAGRIGHRF